MKHPRGPLLFLLAAAPFAAPACAPEIPDGGSEVLRQAILTATQINGSALPAKTVVFTYDDGPDEHTLELAHYLADNGIHATFFVNGRRFCKTVAADGSCTTPWDTRACDDGQSQAPVTNPKYYPESLLDEVVSLGHRIGNHTQDHCHLQMQTKAADLSWEVKTTQDIIDRHICDDIFLFRAPYGEWDSATATRVNVGMGFNKIVGPINWDVDGEDWACWRDKTTPEACAKKYMDGLAAAGDKGIFLMHDRPEFNVGYEGALLMTKVLVPMLKAGGFKFATMDQVLKTTPKSGACMAKPDASAAAPDAKAGGDGKVVAADAGSAAQDAEAAAQDAGAKTADAATNNAGGEGGSGTPPRDARPPSGGMGGMGGSDETGGAGGTTGPSGGGDTGCACAVGSAPGRGSALVPLAALVLWGLRRRRRPLP